MTDKTAKRRGKNLAILSNVRALSPKLQDSRELPEVANAFSVSTDWESEKPWRMTEGFSK